MGLIGLWGGRFGISVSYGRGWDGGVLVLE